MKRQNYYKDNKMQQMHGFYLTAKHGTTVLAAKKVNLTPSNISLQIKEFERELGKCVFDRKGRYLKLNEFGNEIFQKVSDIMERIDDVYNTEYAIENRALRIACHPLVIKLIMQNLILELKKYFPKHQIIIHDLEYYQAIEDLKIDKIDFIICPRDDMEILSLPQYFKAEKFWKYKMTLFCHKNHSIASKQNDELNVDNIDKMILFGKSIISKKLQKISESKSFISTNDLDSLFISINGIEGMTVLDERTKFCILNQNIIIKNIDHLCDESGFYIISKEKTNDIFKLFLQIFKTLAKEIDKKL